MTSSYLTSPSSRAVENIRYTGLIAQEVEAAAKSINYDFSGVKPAKHDKDLYAVSYADLVMPLIKAVQELNNENQALKATITEMEKVLQKVHNLEEKVASLEIVHKSRN